MAVLLLDFLSTLSGALDLISPEVVGHHKRVAYAAVCLARALDLPRAERTDLYMAGLLHDVGGFSTQSRLAALQFETDGALHAELGYRLLSKNPLLANVADIVRHHHTPFSRFETLTPLQNAPPRRLFLANVLNLADRMDVLFIRKGETNSEEIMWRLRRLSGSMFDPVALDGLAQLAGAERYWIDMAYDGPTDALIDALIDAPDMFDQRGMSSGHLLAASTAFSQILDFRSRFTATHTRGVAETAVCLAKKAGFSAPDLAQMRLAGSLHDLGKLAISVDIINKPGPLDTHEMNAMRRHPELSRDILSSVPGLELASTWALQHHEQPGGRGYPSGLSGQELSLGSRILAVADVFTALREDRPYRTGMSREETLRILDDMGARSALDPQVVSLMHEHHTEINERRLFAQRLAAAEFHEFSSGLSN